MFPMPPSLLLPLRLQKALAMCVLTAPQNLQFESPSRPVLDVAVLFTVAVLASLPTGKQATSAVASPINTGTWVGQSPRSVSKGTLRVVWVISQSG